MRVLCATGYFKGNRQATYSRKILWKDAFGQDKVDGIVDSETDGNNIGEKPGSQSIKTRVTTSISSKASAKHKWTNGQSKF